MSNIKRSINIDPDSKKPKYDYTKRVDYSQHEPSEKKNIHFKQDYIVMIRKKLYYAATAQEGPNGGNPDENYLRVYQVNNFLNIRTSHNVSGRPGSCSVSIRGGERVVCADKNDKDYDVETWKKLLDDWKSVNNENIDKRTINDIKYDSLMDAREAKYNWKYAEKCDWEPMDEIWVFGKTKDKKFTNGTNGNYEFLPIFFGYIDSIQKTYQAGNNGQLVNIQATDHLKLLHLSKVINFPSLTPGKFAGNGIEINYSEDQYGNYIINDPFKEMQEKLVEESQRENGDVDALLQEEGDFNKYFKTHIFSGQPPYKFIKELASNAGIPEKYLKTRIEKIEQIPFIPRIRGEVGDLFHPETKNRLKICQEAADKLFLEFFADEAGNIVLKIPSYSLGANREPDNNMNHPELTKENIKSLHEELSFANINDVDDYDNLLENDINIDINENEYFGKEVLKRKYKINKFVVKQNGVNISKLAKKININPEILLMSNHDVIHDKDNIKLGTKIKVYDIDYNDNKEVNGLLTYLYYKYKETINKTENEINDGEQDQKQQTVVLESLSEKTDKYIPEIKPEYIISFTLIDTDREIYNMYEVQMENPPMYSLDGAVETVRRAVPDLNSIVQFGLRPHPGTYTTPLISNMWEAEIFGTMMIVRSLSKRYSGSLTMIEDSAIKIGDPIRIHLYDEHPFKEKYERGIPYNQRSKDKKAQAIFYVTGIERSIAPSNASHMTLQLTAGRVMGQQSMYDISLPLYKSYYDKKFIPKGKVKKAPESVTNTVEIKLDGASTIEKILKNQYGYMPKNKEFDWVIKQIIILNEDKYGQLKNNDKVNISHMTRELNPDETLIIPKSIEND